MVALRRRGSFQHNGMPLFPAGIATLQRRQLLSRTGQAVTAAGMLLLGACSAEDQAQIERLAMPEPATDRAPAIYDLWQGAWIAALAVGVVVWGLIGYAAFVAATWFCTKKCITGSPFVSVELNTTVP